MLKILLGLIFLFFFSFSPVFAAEPPTLDSPPNSSTTSDTSPTLRWNWSGTCPVSGDCFVVQVDDQSTFEDPERKYPTPRFSYGPRLSVGTWYWKVRPKSDENAWSEVWSFTITADSTSATPTPTSISQPPTTSSEAKLALSEFMPNPQEGSEWVEIKNLGSQSANISGYKIDDIEGGSSPFTIPQGTTLNPGGFAVFYFSARLNNEGDTLRLLTPDGAVLESYTYSQSSKGVSFAKDNNGNWRETQTPTPGAENQITQPPMSTPKTKSTGTKTSKSSAENLKTPTPVPTAQILGQKKTTQKSFPKVDSDQDFGTPSVDIATVAGGESSPEAKVAGNQKSKFGIILTIFGGVIIVVTTALSLAKKFGWRWKL